MAHPHLITAFGDGAGQYGPLHLYLIGLATAFVDREIAGRLVSLLCGVLTVVPLYRLGSSPRRMAGRHRRVSGPRGLGPSYPVLDDRRQRIARAVSLMLSALVCVLCPRWRRARSRNLDVGRSLAEPAPKPSATTRGCIRPSSLRAVLSDTARMPR